MKKIVIHSGFLGEKGEDGQGFSDAKIINGELILIKDDSTHLNLGKITGENDQGINDFIDSIKDKKPPWPLQSWDDLMYLWQPSQKENKGKWVPVWEDVDGTLRRLRGYK